MLEDTFRQLIQSVTTTPEILDPRCPLYEDEFGNVRVNPRYVPIEESATASAKGTSFVLFFDLDFDLTLFTAFNVGAFLQFLELRLLELIEPRVKQLSLDDPLPPELKALLRTCRTRLCNRPQPGVNNGELYIWLPGVLIDEVTAWSISRQWFISVRDDPPTIPVGDEGDCVPVTFCGAGVRYW